MSDQDAKLEYSTQSDFSQDVLWLRKKSLASDNEGKRRGLLMPIRREDLTTLREAVCKFFGEDAWPPTFTHTVCRGFENRVSK